MADTHDYANDISIIKTGTHDYAIDVPIIKQPRTPMPKQTNSSVDLELSPNKEHTCIEGAIHAEPDPSNYYMSIVKQEQPSMPKPTVSSMDSESSPNAVQQNEVRTFSSPSTPLCRIFLIIVASLIIGGAIGGSFSFLATRQGNVECSTSSTCPTCPMCTCQTCPTISVPDTGFPTDCQEVLERGNTASGEYMISPMNMETKVPVWCDMETDGGGWTVFQKREDASVDFYRSWDEYRDGFGYPGGDFWLGNNNLFWITNQNRYILRVDLEDFEGETRYAKYDHFRISDEETKFKLSLGFYSGTAGDSLTFHADMKFTTKDDDNDQHESINCAVSHTGAWWFQGCMKSNLNGRYLGGAHDSPWMGIIWNSWKGNLYSLKRTEMKIRRFATF